MNIVRELRKRANLPQKELAAEVGVAVATVSDWETQKKDPSGARLKKLAEIFSVDPLVILGVSVAPAADEDEDLWRLRDRLRRDPEMRTLFSAIDKATPEHVRTVAAVLKTLQPDAFPPDDVQEFPDEMP